MNNSPKSKGEEIIKLLGELQLTGELITPQCTSPFKITVVNENRIKLHLNCNIGNITVNIETKKDIESQVETIKCIWNGIFEQIE